MRVWSLIVPLAVSAPAYADKTDRTVEHAAKTGGDAVVDGARTFGRATKAFFDNGSDAAARAWKKNAQHTKEHAKANGRKTRAAAQ